MFTMARKMRAAQKARLNGERGATPIEILAGLVLLGIIFSFIIVKFFSWRETTQDKGAQARLRDAMLAAESIYTTHQSYLGSFIGGALPAGTTCGDVNGSKFLSCIEPAITWTAATDPANAPAVDVVVSTVAAVGTNVVGAMGDTPATSRDRQVLTLQTRSESGRMWCMRSVSDDGGAALPVGTTFGGGATAAAGATACDPAAVTRDRF